MKPKVTIKCVASHYESSHERIVEFSFPHTNGPLGGLIRFHHVPGGKPTVQLYRVDEQIKVSVRKEQP